METPETMAQQKTSWLAMNATTGCVSLHCKCGHNATIHGNVSQRFVCVECGTYYTPTGTLALQELN